MHTQKELKLILITSLALIFLCLIPFPTQNETKKIVNKCLNEINYQTCYAKAFILLTNKSDFSHVYQTLLSIQDLDPRARDCHFIAHVIASSEVSKDPTSWPKILSQVDFNTCSGGFIHGVIETRSAFDPTFKLDQKNMTAMCDSIKRIKNDSIIDGLDCIHFMGHLAMVDVKGNVAEALKICQQFPAGENQQQDQCFGGVFMENETKEDLVLHGLASYIDWNPKTIQDEENLCQTFTGQEYRSCYRELFRMYTKVYPNDPQIIYQKCYQASDAETAKECYFNAMGQIGISTNPTDNILGSLCRPLANQPNQTDFINCIAYTNTFMLTTSAKFTDRAIFLCNNLPSSMDGHPGRFEVTCFKFLGQTLSKVASQPQRQILCNIAPPEYKNLCIHI